MSRAKLACQPEVLQTHQQNGQKSKKGDENIREELKSRQTTISGLMGSETGVGEAGTGGKRGCISQTHSLKQIVA